MTRRDIPLEGSQILHILAEHGVDYVVIGGVAVQTHGHPRTTQDLDIAPEDYKHYYLNEIPDRYKSRLDVKRFSPGERIVFLPYTDDVYARTRTWLDERKLFADETRAQAAAMAG